MHTLFGDGVHDDYPAIQELLDSGICEIRLPVPQKQYSLSRTLKMHSGQALVLPRYAVIRMKDAANCPMLMADGEENLHIRDAVLRDLWRQESVSDVPMIKIEAGTVIDRLQLSRVFQQAESPLQPPVFINEGTVRTLLCDTSDAGTVPGDQL